MSSLLTYVVCFVEYYNRVFGHFLGDLLRHFRIEKVVEGVDDDIDERHLNMREGSVLHNKKVNMHTDRTPDSKVRAGTSISPVLQDIRQSPDARW
jgi:hypothetical protein